MKSFLFNSLLIAACFLMTGTAGAFPTRDGERARYDFKVDFGKACMTGVLVLLQDDGQTKGSLVNEFGVSALDFSYAGGKVKIVSMMKKLDKWYIRMTLKKDLREVLKVMAEDGTSYSNGKRGITYTFKPLGEK